VKDQKFNIMTVCDRREPWYYSYKLSTLQ